MQFLANRQINFQITVNGQRMMVMFGEPNMNGICAYYAKTNAIAAAVMRHPYFQEKVIWTDEVAEQSTVKTLKAVSVKSGGVETPANKKDEGEREEHTVTETPEDGDKNEDNASTGSATNEDENKEQTFANFTEAKEWFCKTYGVLKSAVRNPTALQREAEARGVVIKIEQ